MMLPFICFLAFLVAAIAFSAFGLWYMGDE
jgi:uncharacterized membrane protein